jgi:hypothetical protein
MLFFNNFYLSSYEQFVFLIFNPLIFKIFNLKLKKKINKYFSFQNIISILNDNFFYLKNFNSFI